MKFDNHRSDIDSRLFFDDMDDDNLSASDDLYSEDDDEELRASKDIEFFIIKPFCGSGKGC